jgi:hypothetical protein
MLLPRSLPHCFSSGLMVLAKSWLIPLPHDALEVRHLLLDHQLRMERNDAKNPNSGVLPIFAFNSQVGVMPLQSTKVDNTHLLAQAAHQIAANSARVEPFDTLADCECQEGLYQCRFSITKICPDCNGNFLKLCAVRNGKPHYRFAVNLVDNSQEIVAAVVGKVGNALFGKSAVEACKLNQTEGMHKITEVCNGSFWWTGMIETRVINDEIYFFLKSAERTS